MTDADSGQALRKRAEEMAREKSGRLPENLEALPAESLRGLLHELRVHQIELELQNEELRRAQSELEASRTRYFDLYDLAPIGYFTLSEKGLILEANLTAAKLLAMERRLLLKQPLTHFILPEDQDLYYRHRKKLLETGSPQTCELRMLRPDAAHFWARLEATAGRDCDGAFLWRVMLSDIAALKLAEEAKERLHVQLLHSQKMEVVGLLAGGVAHDFNNILTSILGNCQLLLDALPKSDPKRTDIEEIYRSGERAAALTRQLLAFSRKQVMQFKTLDLGSTLTNMEKLLQRLIGENIRLTVRNAQGPAFVKADPGQMEQVIMNLAVNARDAMPKGGRLTIETNTIEVSAGQSPCENTAMPPGRYVLLTIGDSGIGMDAISLEHLFEPFFTTKGLGQGTGLGLSTVFGIIKQTGGFIDVQSTLGQGTTFKIFLPATTAAAPAGTREGKVEPERREGKRGGTILLVEDEEIVRRITSRILKSAGYAVLEAGTAQEALGLAGKGFDLLLTDIVLPGLSGTELAILLAKDRPELKVVYMSGYTDNQDIRDILSRPENRFLQKPFTSACLLDQVQDALV